MGIIQTVPWLSKNKRSLERHDYVGYKKDFLLKSDLTPKILKKFGIKASCKEIESKYRNAYTGDFIITGGAGYSKKSLTYSISKLKELLKK